MLAKIRTDFSPEQANILNSLDQHLASGLTVSRLAIDTGIPKGRLESIAKREETRGTYGWGGEAHRLYLEDLEVISEWLELNRPANDNETDYASTPLFEEITNTLRAAHATRDLVAITGSVGVGKSFAGERYARDNPRGHNRAGAVRVQFTKTDNKPTGALSTILEALRGGDGNAYRGRELHNAIGKLLRPGDFLILDECQHLETALGIVVDLYDDFGVGIAMIGNPVFSRAVWGKTRNFEALGSRTTRLEIPQNVHADIEAWIDWRGLPPGLSVTERSQWRKAAVSIGSRTGQFGGIRTLKKVLAVYEARYSAEIFDAALLCHIAKQIKGEA